MTQRITVERNLAGLEDLAFGTGSVIQSRNGKDVSITRINAKNMPFDELRSLSQALEDEKAIAFAVFGIDDDGYLIATYTEEGIFRINDAGDFIIEYVGAL